MFTTKKNIVIWACLVALLLVAAVSFGIAALASESPEVSLNYQNLSYKSNVSIKYAVAVDDMPASATVGIQVRKGSPDSTTVYEAVYEGNQTIGGVSHFIFDFNGLSASEMTVDVYATPYVKTGDSVITVGETKKSSVLEYSYKILGKIGGGVAVSDDIKELIGCMLEYGSAVQLFSNRNTDRLADADYYQITVLDGELSDGFAKGLYLEGDNILLSAPDKKGMLFASWIDSKGNSIGTDKNLSVTVGKENAQYAALYYEANIIYNLNGGTLDGGDCGMYVPGTAYKLPIPERSGYLFSGWFTAPDLHVNNIISEIPESATGTYTLYAKWNKLVDSRPAESLEALAKIAEKSFGDGFDYVYNSEEGVLEWTQNTVRDAQMAVSSGGIAGQVEGNERIFSFEVKISKKDATTGTPKSDLRIRRDGANKTIKIFSTDTAGYVYLGDSTKRIATLTEDITTLRITADFDNGILLAYDADGAKTDSMDIVLPAGDIDSMTYETWFDMLVTYRWLWFFNKSDGALNIYSVNIYAGNPFERIGEKTVEQKREEMQEYVEAQRDRLESVDGFGTYSKNIGASIWGTAPTTPVDEHPRLLVNRDNLDQLRALLANETDPTVKRILSTLDTSLYDKGILPGPTNQGTNATVGTDNIHNYSEAVLEIIQIKALGYLAYGEPLYGYEAIAYMKNYLETLDIVKIASDQCRQYGSVMFTAAIVYDWCYDLLTDTDKAQLIAAVENRICRGNNEAGKKMDIGFPPSGGSTINGYSSEFQLLRDYLAFSVAIYDENDSWWNYVAARVYNDFAIVRNYYYQSGLSQQGTGYVATRHLSDLYSAWILKTATGSVPYVGLENTVRNFIGYEYKPGEIFNDGDKTGDNMMTSALRDLAYITAYVYGDQAMLAQAQYMRGTSEFKQSITGITSAMYLAISSLSNMEPASDRYEGMDLIQYNAHPLGQYVIRASWTAEDSAAVFMRIKERSTSNHEHLDAGTFEIYYKGMLTSDGGAYNNYNHEQTQYFHQSTIAHNGLIIFDASKWNYDSDDKATKWYSGGQRKVGSAGNTFDEWISNENMEIGVVTGRAHGYSDAAKTNPLYAYIAGDITKAYDANTVDYVGRSMLTVYTGNSDFPMVFFVYDDVESDSADYEKRFLLQISSPNEPTVSGNTVITENGDGRLVLTSLSDNARIDAIGGRNEGKYSAKASSNYLINGYQCVPKSDTADDGHWGRIEIVYTAQKKQATFMNVLYVTDAGQTKTAPTIAEITGTGAKGATFGNIAAIFSTSRSGCDPISFETNGTDNMTYYAMGLANGEWMLKLNGTTIGNYSLTDGSGMITFTAAAGKVEILPVQGTITYNTDIGVMPEGTETKYDIGKSMTLASPVYTGLDIMEFLGWYTTPDFQDGTKVTEVPADADYSFEVYAKWNVRAISLVWEDYSGFEDIIITKKENLDYNGIQYGSSADYGGVSIMGKEDANEDGYIVISNKSDEYTNPGLYYRSKGNLKDALASAGTSVVSFELQLRAPEEGNCLTHIFSIRDERTGINTAVFLKLTSNGEITFSPDGTSIGTLSKTEFATIRIAVDFAAGTMTYYPLGGTALTKSFSVKNDDGTIGTTLNWLNYITTYYCDGQTTGMEGSLHCSAFKVYAGNAFE